MGIVKYYLDMALSDLTMLGSLAFYISLSFVMSFIDYPLFLNLVKGFVILYLIALPMKFLFFKERPLKRKYKKLWEKLEASSFPSVHSARSFLIAGVLFFRLPVLAGLFIFALAAVVCYSRIYLKKHYMIDVLSGIMLGLFAAIVLQFL